MSAAGDVMEMEQSHPTYGRYEPRLRTVVDTAVDGVILIDANGSVLMFNRACERLFGYCAGEMLGKNVKCLMPPPYSEEHDHHLDNYHRTGKRNIIGTGREVVGRRKDGMTFPMRLSVGEAVEEGKSVFVGIIHDLTESEESEAKYRGLLEAAPDAMVVVNQAGDIVLLNLQAEKQFRYRRDELLGQKVTNIIPEGFAERLIADDLRSAEEALAQHIGTGIELIARRKDGTEFPIEIMLSPLESAEGTLVTAAIRNISVRKNAEMLLAQMEGKRRLMEEALRESQDQYRMLLDGVKDHAIFMMDPKGQIVSWNAGAERIKGYKADEIIGHNFSCFFPPEDIERGRPEGILRITAATGWHEEQGMRVRKDGSRFLASVAFAALRDPAGKLRGFSEFSHDLSESKEAGAKYRGLLEAAPDAMVVVNQDGDIILLNLQAEKQFGYRRDELLGQKVTNIIPEGFAERLVADDLRSAEEALAQQIGTGIELIGRRKDGTEFPIEIMLSPLESAEGTLVTAAIRNISERKIVEAERKRLQRLKDEFVATVSHELRTPLTSITGALGLLTGNVAGKLPVSAMHLLTIAYTNSQRLVRLLNDILDIEKMDSGKAVFEFKRVEVRSLVQQTIEANRGFAEGYDVRIRLDAASAAFDVRADPDRLMQAITNLLSNAIKFSPPGEEVVVAVETRGDTVRISVRDHGHGVPEEFKPHIFEKFAQADATDARQKGGTGLGLSIVKQIVDRLDGAVGFDDAPGGGAIFHVDLPNWVRAVRLQSRFIGKAQLRVLLCEDNPEAAIVLVDRLVREGFLTDVALTANEAVTRVAATSYAAILVDLQRPEGDGIDLIKQLRAQPQIYNTLLVVLSADLDRTHDEKRPSALLNIVDWLDTPIDVARLVRVLDRPIAVNGNTRPRILHVDSDPKLLRQVADALSAKAEVMSVDSIDKARRALAANRFDVAVLDVALAMGSGFDLLHELRDSEGDAIPLVVFSPANANHVFAAQVRGALIKSRTSIDNLIATLRKRLARGSPPSNDKDPA
jgi:PAS domain S-box-containing protein